MKRSFLLLTVFCLVLSACSLPGASLSASGAQAWLDQPIPGSILPLGAFPLKAHARHVDGSGITRIEFLVNGVPVGAVDTDPAAAIVYGETSWNASVPGQYTLVARAYAGGESSDSAPALVCVSQDVKEAVLSQSGGCDAPEAPAAGDATEEALPPDKQTEVSALTVIATVPAASVPPTTTFTPVPPILTPVPPTATRVPSTATLTPAPPTATRVPSTATLTLDASAPVVDITLVSPQALFYGSGCSAQSGILTVEAYVADDRAVGDVYLVYGFVGAGAEGIFAEMTPLGGGYYRAIVDIGGQAYNFFQGANGEIGIAVIGNDQAGNSAQDTSENIPLTFCPG